MRIARQIARESYTVNYAGIWVRFVALAIDGVILGVTVWLFNGIWAMANGLGWMGGAAAELSYGELGAVFWIVGLLVPLLMVMAYFIGFWGWRGQTPGKMVMRLKVVLFDGGDIGWSGAIMRFLGYIIAVLPFLIGFIWVAFEPRRQGIHDKIAETFVITLSRR